MSQRGADYASRLYSTPDRIAPDITHTSQRIWIDTIKRPPHQDIKGLLDNRSQQTTWHLGMYRAYNPIYLNSVSGGNGRTRILQHRLGRARIYTSHGVCDQSNGKSDFIWHSVTPGRLILLGDHLSEKPREQGQSVRDRFNVEAIQQRKRIIYRKNNLYVYNPPRNRGLCFILAIEWVPMAASKERYSYVQNWIRFTLRLTTALPGTPRGLHTIG